jgi:hypothetical protein
VLGLSAVGFCLLLFFLALFALANRGLRLLKTRCTPLNRLGELFIFDPKKSSAYGGEPKTPRIWAFLAKPFRTAF